MIFDTLENQSIYASLGVNLPVAFQFLMENDLATLQAGRIDLDGERLFALVQEYQTKNPGEGKWEPHRKYIDVQYMVSGSEFMGFANLQSLTLGAYNAEKDFQAVNDLKPGIGNTIEVGPG